MVQIEPLMEILMEDPEKTATNKEFAEWLEEQETLQNQERKEREWRDTLRLRYEKADKSDGDQNNNSEEGSGTGQMDMHFL